MKRNAFGEPQPGSAAEIIQALDEVDLVAAYAHAEIFEASEEEAPFTGWVAEIADFDTGEKRIHTIGFPTKEALLAALAEVPIPSVSVEGVAP